MRTDGTCSGFQDLLELDDEDIDGGSHDMINTLNVVFAIHSKVEVNVSIHYQNLSLMLGKALRHEEKRYNIFFFKFRIVLPGFLRLFFHIFMSLSLFNI